MRLAHISDLHFSYPSFNPIQFFSKRWLGNLNLLLSRKKHLSSHQLFLLPDFFIEQEVTHVLITGDFSSTSLKKEFVEASAFVHDLERVGLKVFTLPGNHDHYTRSAYKKKFFYDFFPTQFEKDSEFNLKEHGLTITAIEPRLWLILLDTTLATSLISSQGLFSALLETHLEKAVSSIPKEDCILLANHYPLYQSDGFKNGLMRAEALRSLIAKFSNIKLYLHGHTHRHCIADLRLSRLPIILDPGSAAHSKTGGIHIMDLTPALCQIHYYQWNGQWSSSKKEQFSL